MRIRGAARLRRATGVLLLAGVAVLLAACAQDLPQNTFAPEGPVARRQADLFWMVFWIAVGVFVVVQGMLLYALVRFRQRKDQPATELPRQVHGNTRLEVIWTLIPALLLTFVAIPTVAGIVELSRAPLADRPVEAAIAGQPGTVGADPELGPADIPEVLEIRVIGHQWWWEYEYPDYGIVTANEMHIPVGTTVQLTMTSRDVIHSFWPPRLAGKQDVIPGRENHLVFSGDNPGRYFGQCAEFCGTSHANMRLQVIVETGDEFLDWVEAQQQDAAEPDTALAEEGAQLFQELACIGCHQIRGTPAIARVGPDLTHFASRQTFAGAMFESTGDNLASWLRDPPAMKPGALMPDLGLSEAQIRALVAYMQSLE